MTNEIKRQETEVRILCTNPFTAHAMSSDISDIDDLNQNIFIQFRP